MNWHAEQLLSLCNLLICTAIGWACICRLNTDICKRHTLARARYTLLLTGATASGLEPLLFGVRPGIGGVIFSGCVLAGMVINVVRWTAPKNSNERENDEPD